MLSKSYNYTFQELHILINEEAKSIALTANCWPLRSRYPYIGTTATWCDLNFDIKEILSIEQFDHPYTIEKVKAKMDKYIRDKLRKDKDLFFCVTKKMIYSYMNSWFAASNIFDP
ncbi:16870_t:CDS:1 [Funneliformis caledonium]|uniref:16870_t:CDS:1 n=1 Tax=Funneliformis caledonium TaxID=1117310 RepID=A0A9N9E8C3_9GLOM|nr:16870_t:CDS:1 [Funneliformis caledonium]